MWVFPSLDRVAFRSFGIPTSYLGPCLIKLNDMLYLAVTAQQCYSVRNYANYSLSLIYLLARHTWSDPSPVPPPSTPSSLTNRHSNNVCRITVNMAACGPVMRLVQSMPWPLVHKEMCRKKIFQFILLVFCSWHTISCSEMIPVWIGSETVTEAIKWKLQPLLAPLTDWIQFAFILSELILVFHFQTCEKAILQPLGKLARPHKKLREVITVGD